MSILYENVPKDQAEKSVGVAAYVLSKQGLSKKGDSCNYIELGRKRNGLTGYFYASLTPNLVDCSFYKIYYRGGKVYLKHIDEFNKDDYELLLFFIEELPWNEIRKMRLAIDYMCNYFYRTFQDLHILEFQERIERKIIHESITEGWELKIDKDGEEYWEADCDWELLTGQYIESNKLS